MYILMVMPRETAVDSSGAATLVAVAGDTWTAMRRNHHTPLRTFSFMFI